MFSMQSYFQISMLGIVKYLIVLLLIVFNNREKLSQVSNFHEVELKPRRTILSRKIL